jgi:hypothetical protein
MANPNPNRFEQKIKPVDAMSPRMQAKLGAYKPRIQQEHEATPRTSDAMKPRNIYRPAKHLNARSGLAICG